MNDILIDLKINKEPYIKKITDDNIINLTGESGSGKSTYAKMNFNNDKYMVIDTDDIFKLDNELNNLLKEKFGNDYANKFINNFDEYYKMIISFYSQKDKILVIDSAQFRNMKNLNNLKGTVIVIRTSIETCYQRCLERYKNNTPNCSKDDFDKYTLKKKNMFNWYRSLNDFITKLNQM